MSQPLKNTARHYVDQKTIPEWGEADDGRKVRITPDEQLIADFAEWEAGACSHDDQVLHKRVNAGGAEMYKHMCRSCGIGVGDWVKFASISGQTVSVDPLERFESLKADYTGRRLRAFERIAAAAANRQQPARRDEYSGRLQSPEWLRKRDLVLKRDGGVCRGCLSRPATQVHHLTYANFGREFAFELISLCDGCHNRIHATQSDANG
jgi:hypothetical protein